MKRRTYLLVFKESARISIDLLDEFAAGVLEYGDVIFRLDDNVAFLQSAYNVETLTVRLRKTALGNSYFFLADITDTSRAGNMVPAFWDILQTQDKVITAADA